MKKNKENDLGQRKYDLIIDVKWQFSNLDSNIQILDLKIDNSSLFIENIFSNTYKVSDINSIISIPENKFIETVVIGNNFYVSLTRKRISTIIPKGTDPRFT